MRPLAPAAFDYAASDLPNVKVITTDYRINPTADRNAVLMVNFLTFTSLTVDAPPASSLPDGFAVFIMNAGTSGTVTFRPSSPDKIDTYPTTFVLYAEEGVRFYVVNGLWFTGEKRATKLYAEGLFNSWSRPIASGANSVAIGSNTTASASYSLSMGYGGTASGSGAVNITWSGTAGASYSTAIGNTSGAVGSVTATGAGAMALGGSYASGADSFAAAVANNTSSYGATGSNSIAMGYLAKASAASSIALSSNLATASGSGSIAIGGYNYGITASGLISVVIGDDSEATTTGAFALGYGASSSVRGKLAFSGRAISGRGLSQTGTTVIGVATTGATPTVLTSDGGAAATNNQVILPNNSAFAFSILIVARQQAAGGTASAAWKIEGLIRREANAASTTLVNSATTVLNNAPGWAVAVSADTTNGGLAVTVTGAAATNIRWVATVQTSEVTYA